MTAHVVLTLPVRTVSESNVRGHWAKKAGRAKGQRQCLFLALRGPLRAFCDPWAMRVAPAIETRLQVILTRIAPRVLDDDNLRGALKACRDGVADALGIEDRDPRVAWVYDQMRGSPRQYAVQVAVMAA